MPSTTTEFGVDLITFYHPEYWGVDTYEDILSFGERNPEGLWAKILDGMTEAGTTLLEMTFPPADWRSALQAFGSPAAFKQELARRGLALKSGFHAALDWGPQTDRGQAADLAAEYAAFVTDAGGDTLVVGPPMRRSRGTSPPFFVDLSFMSAIADLLHYVGDATMRLGVRTAVHTEAHSICCTVRDIDLLMSLTDPTYVFLCPDTGHLVLSGADPAEIFARHHDRVVISHWKDAIGPMPPDVPIDENVHLAHREYFRRVGTGRINWFAWNELVNRSPVSGVTLLELDAVPNPVADMTAAREYIQLALDKLPVSTTAS